MIGAGDYYMDEYYTLREYFARYLKEVRGSSESTVEHYLGALRTISKYLKEHHIIENTIYEISDYSDLEEVKDYLYGQEDFVKKDERGNRMYSAGFNNYVRFCEGGDFFDNNLADAQMDMVVMLGNKNSITVEKWGRNPIIKKQAIEMAHHTCEENPKHTTFTSASSGKQYMEGHHAIPMKQQERFKNASLDVYANIVCLCPICHRLLHYGEEYDKTIVLKKLYSERAERLAKSGIKVSQHEFIELAK